MKKYLYLLFIALFTSLSFTVASCSDDDDAEENIIGTWKCELSSENVVQINYVRFHENGTFETVMVENYNGQIYTDYANGSWSLNGDKLTMNNKATSTIKISGNKLDINHGTENLTYTKCADSEMDQYLK